jgi:hypothetical protein
MRLGHLEMLPYKAFKPIGKHMTYEGGGKGGDAPDAPDYMGLAQQQAQLQQQLINQTTAANRVNQYTPYGSLEWSRSGSTPTFDQAGYDKAMADYNQRASASSRAQSGPLHAFWQIDQMYNKNSPYSNASSSAGANAYGLGPAPTREQFMRGGSAGSGQWSSTVKLTPELQAILDQNIGAKGQSYEALQSALGNFQDNNLPLAPVNAGETAQDAILRRVNPQLNIQEDQLRTRLINQGLRPGTEGWNRELDTMGRQRNDAVSQAALAGINVGNDARARALAEQGVPINLINAYLSGGQAQMPQFQNYSQQANAQAPDLLGAAQSQYGGALNAYNAQQASGSNFMGGLFGLGAAALGGPMGGALGSALGGGMFPSGLSPYSDRRLKRDIEIVGKYENGLTKYRWNYIWGEEGEGVMADEVESLMPEAVGMRNGFKTVNYEMLGIQHG